MKQALLVGLVILLCFQLLGEVTVSVLHLVIPGPVIGMVYFYLALFLWPSLKERVEGLSRFMNTHLALFFIPAGVGIIEYFDLFGKYGWVIALTLLASTAITLGVTAWVFNQLLRGEETHD